MSRTIQLSSNWMSCTNTCNWSGDHECDDGGPGSEYDACGLGTDCDDCGDRGPSPQLECCRARR